MNAILARGRREAVRLDEVDSGERGEILRSYLACSPGARSHIDVSLTASPEDFAQLASHYPIFRVTVVAELPT